MVPMDGLTYAFSTGPGDLENQACFLLKSIQTYTSASPGDIVIYVVDSEIDRLSKGVLSYFDENASIVRGPMPNPDFPLSASHGALVAASRETTNDYIILLDTDTVVLDDIEIQNSSQADLFLKPADLGDRYWASPESINDWKSLYDKYNFDIPAFRVRSTVDNQQMLPYYNGGVILTANNDFPERWLNLSREIHGNLPLSNYFSEMVALALLSSDYSVDVMSEEYNYPLHMHLTVPTGTKVVHYNNFDCVRRAMAIDKSFKTVVNDIGVPDGLKIDCRLNHQYRVFLDIYNTLYFRKKNRPSHQKALKKHIGGVLERFDMKERVKSAFK